MTYGFPHGEMRMPLSKLVPVMRPMPGMAQPNAGIPGPQSVPAFGRLAQISMHPAFRTFSA